MVQRCRSSLSAAASSLQETGSVDRYTAARSLADINVRACTRARASQPRPHRSALLSVRALCGAKACSDS